MLPARPKLDRALAELVEKGTPYEIQFRIRRHDDGFLQVNEQACELTGYDRDELLGRDFQMLFDADVLADEPLRYDLLDD